MLDMRIAVVQMPSLVGDSEANLARIESFLRQASEQSADIVCFPELSISGYDPVFGRSVLPGEEPREAPAVTTEPVPGPSTERLATLGRGLGITFMAGLLERDVSGIVYNTQVVVGPEGLIGSYRKTHVPTSEIGTWRHGSHLPVFDHPKARFGVEICYDSHFPEVSTALAERGAEIIFMPHASGGSETAADKKARWLRYMPARAYDNTVFVAVCNQAGDSGAGRNFAGVSFICDPLGRVIAESTSGDIEEMIVADLRESDLAEARRVPETFFRHFRRPEVYERWHRRRMR